MAIRNVDTELWNDPKVTDEFSHYDKYFWLFLLTTRYGNLSGCFELSIKQMQVDLGLPLDKVKEQIKRFVDYGLIDYNDNTNEILIINYYKHNWNKSPKFLSAVEKNAHKIKNKVFKDYIFTILENDGDDIGYRYGIDTVSIPFKDKDKDKVKDKSKDKDKDLKNKYGDMGNVLLADHEFEKLETLFPNHYKEYIQSLDYYIGSSNKRYKSHYAVLRQWLKRDTVEPKIPSEQTGETAAEILNSMRCNNLEDIIGELLAGDEDIEKAKPDISPEFIESLYRRDFTLKNYKTKITEELLLSVYEYLQNGSMPTTIEFVIKALHRTLR